MPAPAAQAGAGERADEPGERSALELKGRVFVRNTVIRADWENRLTLDSARLGAVYRHPAHGLRVEVEAEFTDDGGEVRDAHLRYRLHRTLRVQVGRFKRPVSVIGLSSRWRLPTAERGALNDLQVSNERTVESDELGLGGRAVGAALIARDRKLWGNPELTVAVMRSPVHAQIARAVGFGNRTPLGWSEGFPEDLIARLTIEPGRGIDLGATVAMLNQLAIAGDRESSRVGYLAVLDARIRQRLAEGFSVSVWVEGFLGSNPLHLTSAVEAVGRFMAARAILAGRIRLGSSMQLEPYVAAQLLDASDELDDDQLRQASAGVNLNVGARWRIQTAVDRASLDRELAAGADRRILYIDNTLFIVQLGAVF
ncbi:MAG: hypothetical protein Tsb0020_38730 [Haliangiales bacterium]